MEVWILSLPLQPKQIQMARSNIERQKELEPERMEYARAEITKLGYLILLQTDNKLTFLFKGGIVEVFPYSGWFTGSSVKDGRGLQKLLDQIKKINTLQTNI